VTCPCVFPMCLVLGLLIPSPGVSQSQAVDVSQGPDGAALIRTPSGGKTSIPKERGQTGIREARIAPDGKSAGWLVEYSAEGVSSPYAGTLIVWRAGRPIRRFRTDQSFWSWAFFAQGRQVAYHVGPLHGEQKSHCELHDVGSGSLIAAWDGDLDFESNRPAWTKGLDH
jgi:hypothetical protein